MKNRSSFVRLGGGLCLSLAVSACATMPATGPSARKIGKLAGDPSAEMGIQVVDVTDAVTRQIIGSDRSALFSESFGEGRPIGSVVGKGDVLDIGIWEAPPAALFGAAGGDPRLTSSGSTARGTTLPEQMVDSDGMITIPFVGRVLADGRTPQQIGHDIDTRLIGKAHQPQTIIRLSRNAAANVTVVGDLTQSGRVPLTARGERILDILAIAGGVKQPVGKTTIQIVRGSKVDSLPLETVIHDPAQNIRLQPDDIMTVLFQPYTFTALGATGKNEEVPFEATGLTLTQALGRVGGLEDSRANVKGVFVFRWEDPRALSPEMRATAKAAPNGRIPVVYRIDMKDPSAFFIAQTFPIRDKDLLYVSNAPLADFQKFVNVILPSASLVTTAAAVAAQ